MANFPMQARDALGARTTWSTAYKFETFYHPYVCDFLEVLAQDGVDGLLRWRLSGGSETSPQQKADLSLFNPYVPDSGLVQQPRPIADVSGLNLDDLDAPYAIYNWELFFHAPLYIAGLLSQNQRFEDAERWYHYIFDATDASTEPTVARYWKFLPFRQAAQAAQKPIQDELSALFKNDPQASAHLTTLVRAWRDNSFQPHLVARGRIWAYPKTVVMKYLDNLIAWGDLLFQQDTMENLNLATLLYIRAAEILGEQPRSISPKVKPKVTNYNELALAPLDDFSDAFAASENLVFGLDFGGQGGGGSNTGQLPPPVLYFGIPNNDKLSTYWVTVGKRLFNIRHCMNIAGQVRQLPLFEPSIDPDLLVRAAAAGVDLSTVLNDLNAPVPHYRFPTMLQKAVEFCGDIRALGGAILAALEKRDAEALARLRSGQEMDLLTRVGQVKEQQVAEAQAALDGLGKAREVIQLRLTYYTNIVSRNPFEIANLAITQESLQFQEIHLGQEILAAILHLIPNFKVGFVTTVGATYGGENVASALQAFGGAMNVTTSIMGTAASLAATMGSYARRQDDWNLQKNLATKELEQSDKQIEGAKFRLAVAQKELENHKSQIENATAVDEFMREKFTNQELYDWMVAQTSSLYFQSYQLAYNMAKRAEIAYRFDRGDWEASFISFGYWDSLRKGLLSGERLQYDLRRMEASYLDLNRRDFELTKNISLGQLAPEALIRLRETGECFIELPEMLFDLDYPGHYLRRIKSVGLTIPCVTGPYTGVNCTLTLGSNRVRLNSNRPYATTGPNDSRFRHEIAAVQSIATSSGQNDAGMFELNFRDERYLPFEGAGAISQWRLELPKETNRFDFGTISDVILHVRYTAKDGGAQLKREAMATVKGALTAAPPLPSATPVPLGPGLRLFSARREFPTEWYRFLQQPVDATPQTLTFDLTLDRFPYALPGTTTTIVQVVVLAKLARAPNPPLAASLTPFNGVETPGQFGIGPPGLDHLFVATFAGGQPGKEWRLAFQTIPENLRINHATARIDPAVLEDLLLLCAYTVHA